MRGEHEVASNSPTGPHQTRHSVLMPNDAQETTDSAGSWWSWRLLGLWLAVNASAYVVIVVGAAALDQLTSGHTNDLAEITGCSRSCSSP